jgi:hypothetical protein
MTKVYQVMAAAADATLETTVEFLDDLAWSESRWGNTRDAAIRPNSAL